MALVSIVIPAYNREKTLKRAVESVLTQTIQDIEVIVVDDASMDNTVAVAKELARSDPRVRLIQSTSHHGAQAARNLGARDADGDWLCFFDSDDYMLPASVKMRLRLAHDRGLKVVHSDAFVLRSNQPRALFGVPPLSGFIYDELLRTPGPMFPGMIVRADVFREMGELDEDVIAYQEWDTAIRLARRHTFGFLPEPTFVYDCTGDDTISKDLTRSAMGYEYVVNKHRFEIIRRLGPRAMSQHFNIIAGFYADAAASDLAAKAKLKSFLWWPSPRRAAGCADTARSLVRIGFRRTVSGLLAPRR
jgi:glycosyltransferase involved in cell wall biosynthesis